MSEAEKKNSEQVRAGVAARTGRLLPPPVGTSDWARFSRTSYCVDKTLILKDLIDAESTVVLFTRPRRFGKTTALEMIRAFYEDESSLFQDKKIWAAGEVYRKEQGRERVGKRGQETVAVQGDEPRGDEGRAFRIARPSL